MKFGPKYKICRRVGDRVFGKCEDPKFELTPPLAKGKRGGRRGKTSEYGTQLIEKQRVRFTYGVSEKQFSNYVKKASAKHGANPAEQLYESLERRLDNTIYRMGIASSRTHARQMVSHGHILVNDHKVNIPSYQVRPGEVIRVKDRTKGGAMIQNLAEQIKIAHQPDWMIFDPAKMEAKIQGLPNLQKAETTYNLTSVIEFYSR